MKIYEIIYENISNIKYDNKKRNDNADTFSVTQ